MNYHATANPDPAWTSTIVSRRAVLWIGKSCGADLETQPDVYVPLLAQPWHSVFADCSVPDSVFEMATDTPSLKPFTLRPITGDPDDRGRLASNRIPVFGIPASDPIEDPMGYAARLKMFQRLPLQGTIFVLSRDPSGDLETVRQATKTVGEVQEIVVVSTDSPVVDLHASRKVHWQVDARALIELLGSLTPPADALAAAATIAIRTPKGIQTLDLSGAVDPSYPITDRFELVPASAVLSQVEPAPEHVLKVLRSPSESWEPYSAGVVFNRTAPYETMVTRAAKAVTNTGPDADCTLWIDAQQASGASTMLRDLLVRLSRLGLPILVARPETTNFDFQQVSSFLRSAASVADAAERPLSDTPWVIAFDAEHSMRSDDFVCGLANGLRKLNRHAVVLAIRPILPNRDRTALSATGHEETAREPMLNLLSQDEAEEFGKHLNRYLPSHQRRRETEWRDFAEESERLTGDGRQSLFWLALRFWLMRLPGADQPLRQWLSSQIETSLKGKPARLSGVLVIAALSRHRLACPARLLTDDERSAIRPLLDDVAHPLGLRELWGERRGSFAFAHPLFAEELLRICSTDSDLLRDAGVSQCAGLLDFELQLFERIFTRPEVGLAEVVPIIEEVVVSALRVDPRDAPQNYAARDRIVPLLERAPDSVFDSSPVFLHHLAKARRHLAADPPLSGFWNEPDVRREQLDLADGHIREALSNDNVDDEDRSEKPLNLHVSLALTYGTRADLERDCGEVSAACDYAEKAQVEFGKAQSLDPDNTYVLENFARLKLRGARDTEDESQRLRLLVDAISLLDWELAVDTDGRREDAVMESLASAYAMLEDQVGLRRLQDLASDGSESATVAIARLLVRSGAETLSEDLGDRLREAIDLLIAIPASNATWRSRHLLYQCRSRLDPHDFEHRLDPLDELEAMGEFPWPIQLKLEYGILLYQMGRRRDGQKVFQDLRDTMASRSGALRIPLELKYLADPKRSFRVPLRTALRVTNATSVGRNYYGVPEGWGAVDVPFRPYLFGRREIRRNDDLDCFVQFTSFGPQAVPPTES
ncbi:MAG: hypothetical protein RLN60_03975 [Phycisphaerales bacterium]